jgi:hypothetical protein
MYNVEDFLKNGGFRGFNGAYNLIGWDLNLYHQLILKVDCVLDLA